MLKSLRMKTNDKDSGLGGNQGWNIQSTETCPGSFSLQIPFSIVVLLHVDFFFFFLSLGLLHVNKMDTRRAPCPSPCPKVNQPRIHLNQPDLLCGKFSPLIRTFVSHVFKILTHKVPNPRSVTTCIWSSFK